MDFTSEARPGHSWYPSLKDMLNIKNSRVPEFSRRFARYNLNYHGMSREAWSGLSVDLVRGEGTLLAMDCVTELIQMIMWKGSNCLVNHTWVWKFWTLLKSCWSLLIGRVPCVAGK